MIRIASFPAMTLLIGWSLLSCNQENLNYETYSREVVYGNDDRMEFYDPDVDQNIREIVEKSIVAQINIHYIDDTDENNIQLQDVELLGEKMHLCDGEVFANQPAAARCSGTLIDDDLVLTAGHCIKNDLDCFANRWVFNYYYAQEGVLSTITVDDIYRCEQVLVQEYTPQTCGLDYAIVKLDRPVIANHSPALVKLADAPVQNGVPVTVVGFPNGIPVKIDDGGKVLDGRPVTKDFFSTNTDSFHGNSGSGVFDENNEIIGIIVRGATDYVTQGDCNVVNVLPNDGGEEVCGGVGENATYVARAIQDLCNNVQWPSDRLCVGECNTGECCDIAAGKMRPSSYSCDTETERSCSFGMSCGSDVGERERHRYCSGTSEDCPATWSEWSAWIPAILCPGSERCSDVGGTAHCYEDPACSCECTAGSGPCCDACSYRPSSYKCEEHIAEEYYCPEGTACGGEVFVRRLDKYCSGTSAQCTGMGAWDTPAVVDDCDQASRCQPGNPVCYVDPACGGHPPELRNGDVDPSSGYGSDSFHFTVDFKDEDDDAPSKSDVIIVRPGLGDLTKDMQKIGSSPDYLWNEYAIDVLGSEIGLGTWSYHFEFESDGGSARRPSSGEFTGPSVMDAEPNVQITEPFGSTLVPGGGTVPIEWTSTGCASVSLAYTSTRDIPPIPGAGTTIGNGLPPVGTYNWNIGSLADGTYWILAECYNMTGAWDWHYGGPVTVTDVYVSDRAWYPPEDVSSTGSYPDVAVGPDGAVHVVWSSSGTIYSRRSPDGTWSTPTTISNLNAGEGLYRGPRIAIGSDGRVHVAYSVDWPVGDIKYVGLDSNGNVVLGERTVYDGTNTFLSGIAVDGSDRIHIACVDDVDYGYVYWSRSTDNGTTFSPPTILGSGSDPSYYNGGRGGIAASGDYVHVVAEYRDWDVINDDVLHYFGSSNGGGSWSGANTIATGSGNGIGFPEIAAYGSDVHVIFNDNNALSSNQVYMHSTNGGAGWSSPVELPVLDTNRGDVAALGSQVFVVTTSGGGFFTESPDSASWSDSFTVHPDLGNSKIDAGLDGRVHIVGNTSSSSIVYIASRPPQSCPTMNIVEPSNSVNLCSPFCSISWIGTDEDDDTLSVRLSYDIDKDPAATTGISGADSLPGTGMFSLDTTLIPSGSYWIYFEITDGICTRGFYSDGQIVVDRPPSIALNTPPPEGARAYPAYVLDWEAVDPEGRELDVSIKWADAEFPDVYYLVAADLSDMGEYIWDLTGFEHGKVLNLVAIVSDRVNASIVSHAQGQLVVHHPDRVCVFDSDCPPSNLCSDGYCVCIPDCTGLECGPDPNCGQSCGTCSNGEECSSGLCVPACTCSDGDVDGHYPESCADTDCSPRDDCDDARASVHPGATEVCINNIDDDCDGSTDEGCGGNCECTDNDEDGHYTDSCADTDCSPRDDCEDSSSAIHPGADESCNGIDDDCDGRTDEGFDADQDGYTPCGNPADCNDNDGSVYPGAEEIINDGIDQDCDGEDATEVCQDNDQDGYQDMQCGGNDCDDGDININPGANEICDGIDNNCNESIDEGVCPSASEGCKCSSANGSRKMGVMILCLCFLVLGIRRLRNTKVTRHLS